MFSAFLLFHSNHRKRASFSTASSCHVYFAGFLNYIPSRGSPRGSPLGIYSFRRRNASPVTAIRGSVTQRNFRVSCIYRTDRFDHPRAWISTNKLILLTTDKMLFPSFRSLVSILYACPKFLLFLPLVEVIERSILKLKCILARTKSMFFFFLLIE